MIEQPKIRKEYRGHWSTSASLKSESVISTLIMITSPFNSFIVSKRNYRKNVQSGLVVHAYFHIYGPLIRRQHLGPDNDEAQFKIG